MTFPAVFAVTNVRLPRLPRRPDIHPVALKAVEPTTPPESHHPHRRVCVRTASLQFASRRRRPITG